MTFILSLQGKNSIWLCADRRLTYPNRFTDTGIKLLSIEGMDGRALLGYAGLGSSKSRTEPSAWMNDLLKGKGRLRVEEQLGLIASAMKAELPQHLAAITGEKSHVLIATAIIEGKVRVYQLSVAVSQRNQTPHLIYTRREMRNGLPHPFAVTGSGAEHLPRRKGWHRDLLRIVRAVETGHVNPRAVADRMATINEMVAEQDQAVSKKCVVKWWAKSGGSQFYDGKHRVSADIPIPSIFHGTDIHDIFRSLAPLAQRAFADLSGGGQGKIEEAEMNAALRREFSRPNRKL